MSTNKLQQFSEVEMNNIINENDEKRVEFSEVELNNDRDNQFNQSDDRFGGYRKIAVQLSNVMESKGAGRRVHLAFRDVCAWVPQSVVSNGWFPQWKKQQELNLKQILYNIHGEIEPGEVLALMGPSGSGKTTLLSILGGRTQQMVNHEGQILFNGKQISKSIKRNLGYVMQDDLLFEALTVYETLKFAAYLRLPRDTTNQEKDERLADVILALGLEHCQDTIIGGAARRGVSGGERKRVSVGHELITNPSVIFLDEPTSGLDSTAALKLIQILKDLSQGGRSIITTIHQPSSRLYLQLDKLLLLCEGHTMYYGNAQKVSRWFQHLEFSVPFGVNIADHILDLANGDIIKNNYSKDEIKKYLIKISENFQKLRQKQGFQNDEDLNLINLQKLDLKDSLKNENQKNSELLGIQIDSNSDSDSDHVVKNNSEKFEEGWELQKRQGASYKTQFHVLLIRAFKNKRFNTLGIQQILQIALVGLMCGLLWWQAGRGDSLLVANDIASLLFFQGLFPSFLALFSALFSFPPEFKLLQKERTSGMYRLSAYYFSKTASDIPWTCLEPSIFVVIIYWMTWLKPNFFAFLANWAAVLLSVLTAESFGLFVGASVMHVRSAQTIASVVMLTLMLAGGFMVRDVPSWISWIKNLSFVYWVYSLQLKIQFRGEVFVDCGELGTAKECEYVYDLNEALSLPRDVNGSPWVEVVVLMAFLIVFRVGIYYVLNLKTRNA